jgi:uncharacterized repeat protein (TIGR04138 family)
MASATKAPDVPAILAKAGPYPVDAYQFVQDGLRHTVRQVQDQRAGDPGLPDLAHGEHVTGQQLCVGLRDFAIDRYGMLARAVLAGWGIHRTEDFGRMVFALIEAGAMSKTPHDTVEHFCGVYDFAEAFHPEQAAAAIRVPVA